MKIMVGVGWTGIHGGGHQKYAVATQTSNRQNLMEKGKIQWKKWKQENLAIWQEIAKYGRKAQRTEIPWQIIGMELKNYGPTLHYLSTYLILSSYSSVQLKCYFFRFFFGLKAVLILSRQLQYIKNAS